MKQHTFSSKMLQLFHLSLLILQFTVVLTKNPSVIIVGAGPAGIAAATRLLENSITNITVLEAGEKIGGRIHSVKFGDGYVDVGAEYCHGEKGNIVYELVKDLDLLEHSKKSSDAVKLYYSNGSTIAPDIALDVRNTLSTYDENLNTTSGASLGEAFLAKYKSTIIKKYADDQDKLKVVTEAIKFLQDNILMHEGAFSWLLPAAGRHYTACDGDQTMSWKTRGYQIIFDVLKKSYPDPSQELPIDDKIFFNKKVNQIIWNGNEVMVKSSDNSSLIADHVIFTPSIGVLPDIQFQPQLPAHKKNALTAIGFNGIIKMILQFPKKWWNDEQIFYFVWKEEDLLGIKKEFPYGPKKDEIPWVSQISAVATVASNPKVLIAWVSGDLVPEIETIPSKVVLLSGCMYVIKKFLGKDYNVSDADDIISSRWYTNPNFRGTYSYEKAGYFEKDISYQAQLAEPLPSDKGTPVLLFAGEATHPTLYSTVHGAVDSGRREADRIINLSKEPFY